MSKKYQSADQAVNAIDFSGVPSDDRLAIQGEIRNAVRPVLATLFQTPLSEQVRDQLTEQFVDTAVPAMLKSCIKHLGTKAA